MPVNRRNRDLAATHSRNIRTLELRPSTGQGTAVTVARGRRGSVACDITDGAYQIVSDLGTGQGGQGLGPDPGILIRSGLASCLVGGYQLWAAHMGIVLEEVEVAVEADYDARGMYAVGDGVPPGYLGVRVRVHIVTSAPEDRVREMVEHADRHSPLIYDFTTALDVKRDIHIAQPAAEEA